MTKSIVRQSPLSTITAAVAFFVMMAAAVLPTSSFAASPNDQYSSALPAHLFKDGSTVGVRALTVEEANSVTGEYIQYVARPAGAALKATGRAVKSTYNYVKSIRANVGNHGPHHQFQDGSWRNHIQVDVYRKGVPNSHRSLRIPYGKRYDRKHGR